ncbi:CE1759 family FMN reductase [Curtobacterium herbarum]|uniref:FMN reductase n=1 Tax=Curtobacterium herbarum TaxID=150122 RepID=A0ABP4K101_9MICO|nr:CE1759 family FMN reductase [Curtobacterium herbarum]MBM7475990.1 FMN reductase [Curtobacterium herbarum]MCS6544441.1 NAD(P)H-dependent oxidoreductase [Curtobacterium herbarum]
MTTIAVVSAGLSEPSSTRLLADRLGAATLEALSAEGTAGGPVELRNVDLRPLAHEITDAMLTRFAAPALAAATATVVEADAVVFVTPVFTAGMSGLAKSFLDVLDKDALTDMPVLLGATGGTARHSLALEHGIRPVFAYLRAAVVPTGVFAATDDWGSDDAGTLDARIRRAGADLAWMMRASRRQPQQADALPEVVDFASLLGGVQR